jgi:DNA-binding beta-propeller fold protein YncE
MALLPTDPTKAVLAATAATDSTINQDVHLIDLALGKRIASASAFGDGKAIVASVAVAPDGKFALLADNGLNAGSRLAAVAVSPSALTAAGSLLTTPYPDGVAISPYDNSAFVLNDDSTDQIHLLSYTQRPLSRSPASSSTSSASRRSRPPSRSSTEAH